MKDMQFVNRSKLKGAIAEQGLKRSDLAEELCIKLPALSEKIAGRRRFNEDEMAILAQRFGKDIFFLD